METEDDFKIYNKIPWNFHCVSTQCDLSKAEVAR